MKSWLAVVSFGVVTGFAVSAVATTTATTTSNKAALFRAQLVSFNEVPSVSSPARGEFYAIVERRGHGVHVLADLQGPHVRRGAGAYPLRPAPHERRHQRLAVPEPPFPRRRLWRRTCRRARAGDDDAHHARRSRLPTSSARPARASAAGEFAELLAAMRAGAAYANVHSGVAGKSGRDAAVPAVGFPGGEIRGQIN